MGPIEIGDDGGAAVGKAGVVVGVDDSGDAVGAVGEVGMQP